MQNPHPDTILEFAPSVRCSYPWHGNFA